MPQTEDLSAFPRAADGPLFAEPWQAQAFALAVQLHAAGAFSWNDWAAALSAELKAAEARGESDDGSRYYEHWLAALERLVGKQALELEFLKGAQRSGRPPRSAPTSAIAGPAASPPRGDAS